MKMWSGFFAALLLILPLGASAATANPQTVVQNATNSLLQRILQEKETLKQDPQALYRLVDENITPFMDVDGIARRVMGQYYRQATAEQRTEFARVFKQSLIRTYAKGLTSYDKQKIEFRPWKAGNDPQKAQVDVNVYGNDGQIYPVAFQLQLNKDGEWKVQNLILNGINLGLTFRNQFSAAVENNRGSIDKAVAGWAPDATNSKEADGKASK